jgi:hypothetical protein
MSCTKTMLGNSREATLDRKKGHVYLVLSPLFNQVGKLRTSAHLQLQPVIKAIITFIPQLVKIRDHLHIQKNPGQLTIPSIT